MTTEMTDTDQWTRVGDIAVDTGNIIVADPAYVLKGATEDGLTFEHAVGLDLPEMPDQAIRSLSEEGQGLLIQTGFGDGFYPVFARIDNGRVMGLRIDFVV